MKHNVELTEGQVINVMRALEFASFMLDNKSRELLEKHKYDGQTGDVRYYESVADLYFDTFETVSKQVPSEFGKSKVLRID